MSLELLLAVLQNLNKLAFPLGFLAVCFLCAGIVMIAYGKDFDEKWLTKLGKKSLAPSIITICFAFLLGIIPTINQLWKVRVGLIKLQLASPQNIEKGVETIERIGKKLECKYVGCEKEKVSK